MALAQLQLQTVGLVGGWPEGHVALQLHRFVVLEVLPRQPCHLGHGIALNVQDKRYPLGCEQVLNAAAETGLDAVAGETPRNLTGRIESGLAGELAAERHRPGVRQFLARKLVQGG